MIRELIRDLTKYSPSLIVPAVVGLIAVPIVTRLFPPSQYGDYVLVVNIVSLISLLAVSWLCSSTLRFSPAYELNGRAEEFRGTLPKLLCPSIGIILILSIGVLFLIRNYISTSLYSLLWIGLLVFAVTSCWNVLITFLRARRRAAWYSVFAIWLSIAGLGFGILLVLNLGIGVEGLLWGTALCTIVALPFLWRISLGLPSLRLGSIKSPMSQEIAKYGIPAMVVNILTWAQSYSDRYILAFFRGSQEVGIYSASYTVAEASLFMINSLFLLAASPIGFHIWENQGVKASQEFLNKLTRYYLLVGLPAAVGLSVLARPLINVLVAPEYWQGYAVIPLVAFGAFFLGVAHRFTIGLSYHKRNDLVMFCYLGAVVLNIALNLFLVPRYGFMAAAANTLASYLFLLLLAIVVSRRFFLWAFPFKSLLKTICASAVMGMLVFWVVNILNFRPWANVGIAILLGVIIYIFLLFLIKEIMQEEKGAIKEAWQGIHRRLFHNN